MRCLWCLLLSLLLARWHECGGAHAGHCLFPQFEVAGSLVRGEAADGLLVGEDDDGFVRGSRGDADGFALIKLLAVGVGEGGEGVGVGEVGRGDVEALVEARDVFEDVEGGEEDFAGLLEVRDYGCGCEGVLLLLVAYGRSGWGWGLPRLLLFLLRLLSFLLGAFL